MAGGVLCVCVLHSDVVDTWESFSEIIFRKSSSASASGGGSGGGVSGGGGDDIDLDELLMELDEDTDED